uniref:SH2 domain-containing protein n=1 Tax=Mola mola TaxID=94237 RepID=A0A3Q3WNY3_MOLML
MAAALPMCYHGAISRKECEDLLGKKNKEGAYLIRDSETIQGAKCLCVYKQRVVYTYRVLQTHTGLYTLMGVFFKTLDDLIRHFKRRNQGLAMHLRHSVKRKTAMLSPPSKRPASQVTNQTLTQGAVQPVATTPPDATKPITLLL